MARLHELSTELILDILGRIPPEDLESTTLISKTVYPIARILLDQHRQVLVQHYQKWDDIVVLRPTHPLHGCTHMHASLLCTILTDRRLAKMVKVLSAINYGSFYPTSEIDLERAWRPEEQFPGSLPSLRKSQRLAKGSLKTRIQILEEALCQCIFLTESQRKTWLKELHAGNEELAAVLLLWHLPALRSITLDLGSTASIEINASIFQTVEYGVTASAHPTSVHISAGLPLQYLERVSLVFEESRSEDVALVRAFLSLPRLSTFSCQNLFVSSVRKTAPTRKVSTPSTMKSLAFGDCILHIAALFELFEGVIDITDFAYTWYGNKISDEYEWVEFGPCAVIAALVGSIGHRLETLVLRVRSYAKVQYMDVSLHFRDFRALKELTIGTNILLAGDGSNLTSFAFMLPARLEQLTLHWIKCAPVPEIRSFSKLLKAFADQAKCHLTSLSRVRVVGYLEAEEMEELLADNVETGSHTIGHLSLSVYSHEGFR